MVPGRAFLGCDEDCVAGVVWFGMEPVFGIVVPARHTIPEANRAVVTKRPRLNCPFIISSPSIGRRARPPSRRQRSDGNRLGWCLSPTHEVNTPPERVISVPRMRKRICIQDQRHSSASIVSNSAAIIRSSRFVSECNWRSPPKASSQGLGPAFAPAPFRSRSASRLRFRLPK
jgi:hypothetical protein